MGSVVHGLGGRYATALYELAREEKREAEVEASMTTLKAALADSNELRALDRADSDAEADPLW